MFADLAREADAGVGKPGNLVIDSAVRLKGDDGSAVALATVVGLMTRTAPSALSSSITELDGPTYSTPVASSSLALDLDRAQDASEDDRAQSQLATGSTADQ